MKRILYSFLVLAVLYTCLYLLPWRIPFFEYIKLKPVFEMLSIVLLVYTLYLYQREKRKTKEVLSQLSRKNLFLDLAIRGGNMYVFEYKNNEFLFESAIGDLPLKVNHEEMFGLIHPDDLVSFKLRKKSLKKANKEIYQCRARFFGADYQWWEFRYSAVPAATHVKECDDVSGILVNINDMKKREKELILMRGYEQKFLANMSHEIRTPLNAIVGFSNLLALEKDLEETDKQLFIKTINQNCDLLLVLINDILEISRLESGQMIFAKEKCSVKELIDGLYLTHQLLIPSHLRFLKEEEGDLSVYTDKKRLTQVVTNFLTNACKFTENGYIKIGFKHLRRTDEVAIFVEDSGIGLSKEQQKKVFSRFFKQDEFSQGAGLGLSICQGIVQNLGGRIELNSTLGKGSRFSVVFPIYKGRHS